MMICRLILLAFLTMALSCSGPTSGEVPVELVQRDENSPGQYRLVGDNLHNVIDLYSLSNPRFTLVKNIAVEREVLLDHLQASSSFEELIFKVKSGLRPIPVFPRLIWTGAVWAAQDFDSLAWLTVYANFERVWDFFKTEVKDKSGATDTPTWIGAYGTEVVGTSFKMPTMTSDNAAYLPGADVWIVLRVGDQEGLPFDMNRGVIAHEFQHRVFFYHVWVKGGAKSYALWKKQYDDQVLIPSRASILLGATDEGLADIHAIGMTRELNFLDASFVGNWQKKSRLQRDLTGAFANEATYDNLSDGTLNPKLLRLCNEPSLDFKNPDWRRYCLGTVLARALWESSGLDFGVLRQEILPLINASLDDVGTRVGQGEIYDLHMLWEALAAKAKASGKPGIKNAFCQQVNLRFRSLYKPAKVPSCF